MHTRLLFPGSSRTVHPGAYRVIIVCAGRTRIPHHHVRTIDQSGTTSFFSGFGVAKALAVHQVIEVTRIS